MGQKNWIKFCNWKQCNYYSQFYPSFYKWV